MFGMEEPVFEETIYNILPPPAVEVPKMKTHKSKYPWDLPPTASTFGTSQTSVPGVVNLGGEFKEKTYGNHEYRKQHATLGKPPGSFQPDPTKIMPKGSKQGKVDSLATMKKFNPEALAPKEVKDPLKPPVPRRDEKPIMNLVSSKNFVTANAVENILAAPKKVGQEVKDYLHKADYGCVPAYLNKIKRDISEEYEYIRKLQEEEEEAERSSHVRQLTDSEKEALIEGLKAKWEKVNTDYQATTHITKLDTIGKVRRKEQYEALLTQIEKDIEKLHKRTVVVDLTY
jgi:hypothetical protein